LINVKISTTVPEWPWVGQTPGSHGVWGDCKFFVDRDVEECDFWVVVEGFPETQTCCCPPENTLLITMEPYSKLHYSPRFLRQFGAVLTFHRDIQHPKVIHSPFMSAPWMVSKNYDELKDTQNFTKDKVLSVICSSKAFYPGHVKRLEFVKNLAERLDVDVYGRGINDFEGKWDVVAPYKYHVAIENSSLPDYFTDKLADSFLSWAYPFYYGCPNLGDYFPEGSFIMIDVDNFEESIEKIEKAIKDGVYEKSVGKIHTARELVLDRYNLFPAVVNIIHSLELKVAKKKLTLITARECQSFSIRVMNRVSTEFFLLRTRRKVRNCIQQLGTNQNDGKKVKV
jgi:hypothetical protein